MTGALEMRDVSFAYDGTDIVRGVSLTVAAGEIVCLLGPSGCGKTTCLRIAAGLERLQRGSVHVAGKEMAAKGVFVPPEKRQVGLVLQDFALFPHLSVIANVAFGIRTGSRTEKEAHARRLLDQVGLADYGAAYPHQLSGGQQQRVALARALAPKPAVMLMDEPFSALDVTLRADVRQHTVDVLKARGVPTLIVTHDPEEALAVADRIVIMRQGKILQAGPPEELYLHPADPFVMTFFGAPNRLSGQVHDGVIQTAFGEIEASGLHEGAAVNIFFRGAALSFAQDEKGRAMRVEEARLIGPVQRLILRDVEDDMCFVMEHPRRDAVSQGDLVHIVADLQAFYAFPAFETAA